jgi:membrane protease YdiL (CAAX protease family)
MSEPFEVSEVTAPGSASDAAGESTQPAANHAYPPAPASSTLESSSELDPAPSPVAIEPFAEAPGPFIVPPPEPALPPKAPPRTPNFGDMSLFVLLLVVGIVVAAMALGIALFLHAFGNLTLDTAKTDARFLLSFELVRYLVALVVAVPMFGLLWKRSFFSGLHWHGETARRLWLRLMGLALGCNLVALAANAFLPFPKHAPIEMLFQTPMQAWLMFAFGVLVAPFFEEMLFRGFVLPAMATAWDWCGERIAKTSPRPLDAAGHPTWSLGAMIFGSIAASIPFALMHAGQVSNAWGPLSVLFTVSMVLCVVRLTTRSLASSTLVHATYNFVIFTTMLIQTGGFQHLDKI